MKSRTLEAIKEKYEPIFDDPDFYLENELLTLFNDALKRLPESYREAFEMSRFDGMTHKEIADLLNVSRQTVNYRLSKALEILREELKDYLQMCIRDRFVPIHWYKIGVGSSSIKVIVRSCASTFSCA